MSLSRSEFNKQSLDLVHSLNLSGDEWKIFEMKGGKMREVDLKLAKESIEEERSQLMMSKVDCERSSDNLVCQFEYSIVYSESYEVPVMYFNANLAGKLSGVLE